MTEQLKPGLVYATRGGDRVRVTGVNAQGVIWGVVENDAQHWQPGGHYYSKSGGPSTLDLLPGALPDPAQDDKAELVAALRECAKTLDDAEAALIEFEVPGAVIEYVRGAKTAARAAIAKAERTS